MRKQLLLLFIVLFLSSSFTFAANTAVTATITGQDGQTWNNGTYIITFRPTPGVPGPYTVNGVSFNQGPFTGSLSSVGVLTVTLTDNLTVQPGGSTWQMKICPNASNQCLDTFQVVTGATQNLSTTLSALTPVISVNAAFYPRAYSDSQVATPSGNGSTYFNTINNTPEWFNNGGWYTLGDWITLSNKPVLDIRSFGIKGVTSFASASTVCANAANNDTKIAAMISGGNWAQQAIEVPINFWIPISSSVDFTLINGWYLFGHSSLGALAVEQVGNNKGSGFIWCGANAGKMFNLFNSRDWIISNLSFVVANYNTVATTVADTVLEIDQDGVGGITTHGSVYNINVYNWNNRPSINAKWIAISRTSISNVENININGFYAYCDTFTYDGINIPRGNAIFVGSSSNAKGEQFRNLNGGGCNTYVKIMKGSWIIDGFLAEANYLDLYLGEASDPSSVNNVIGENSGIGLQYTGSTTGNFVSVTNSHWAPGGHQDNTVGQVVLGPGSSTAQLIWNNNSIDSGGDTNMTLFGTDNISGSFSIYYANSAAPNTALSKFAVGTHKDAINVIFAAANTPFVTPYAITLDTSTGINWLQNAVIMSTAVKKNIIGYSTGASATLANSLVLGDNDVTNPVSVSVRGTLYNNGVQWTSGAGAPAGACVNGALYTDQTAGKLYVCEATSWVAK